MNVDPFVLFPRLVRQVELVKPQAAGLAPERLATLSVIVKAQTASDDFTDYASRNLQRRLHVKTSTVPAEYREVDTLLGLNILMDGRTYRITKVDRGDDFNTGSLPFMTLQVVVSGRRNL